MMKERQMSIQTPALPLRAVLYARYSTDKQRETSIADQLRGAHERAAREGWSITATHADEGISGSTPVALRPGGKALLADALAGRFDVLVLEGLDRLSRELGEAETITKRLEHRGIRIVGTADGYDSEARGRKVMRIARGLVNELYLDDLREKTHRGLAGQFDRGYHVGGVTYGYRSHLAEGGRGKVLAIDEEQAEVVRWVFGQYAAGHSARAIVHQLNAQGTTSARGHTWAVSAVQGSIRHGLGLLHNEIYTGRQVWNRRQWVKDPETGKRRYVERPRSEWQVRETPALRIIDAGLWHAVQTRVTTGPPRGTRTGRGAVPKTLFAGLVRCPACSGPMVAVDARRYGCSRHHDRGATACESSRAFSRERVERALLAVVRDELLSPKAIAELHRAVKAEVALARGGRKAGGAQQARLQALQGEITRLVDAVAALGLSEALRSRLRAAEAERDSLLRTPTPAPQAELDIGALVANYRRQLLQLREALDQQTDRDRVRTLLADLLGPVHLVRDDDGSHWAEIEEPAQRLLVAGSTPVGVVAGARFELATFGL